MTLQSINPATGELLEQFPETEAPELERILAGGETADRDWGRRSVAERLPQGEAEAEKCATACDYYAEHAAAMLAPVGRETDARHSYVRFDPIGPVFAIMPWNFPFWQVIRFAAPALVAGNAVILKHAPNVSRCALEIEGLFRAAGFPEGLFRAVFLDNAAAGRVIADPRIRAVTFTGSDRGGAQVAEQAGRHVKKTVLELGGSDPFVVLHDADLAQAAKTAADARLVNSGQSCIAAKRFIVVEPVFAGFVERFTAELGARKVGDPLAPGTEVGPQARLDLRANLHLQVEESVRRGARLALGGRLPGGPGAFYPPSLLVAVDPGMPAFDEEVFGPVAAVIRARDESHAVALANASRYGLGASLWTEDRARGERLAAEIEAGAVFVNGLVKSDPRLPFGGVKRSG
ncbi:MAG: NADP-dependent succinic semialdehyde dehydrogenase, partial [Gemmatimonadetes bacterium 13_1_40CM_70_11]